MSAGADGTATPPHPLVDAYVTARAAVCAHVGYVDDWRLFPLDDQTEMYWNIDQAPAGNGSVTWSPDRALVVASIEDENDGSADAIDAEIYSGEIYTYRHLPKYVYRGPELTVVLVATGCDLNINLFILRNDREVLRTVALPKRGAAR